MLTLKDYVNWGITHSDKTGSAEGVPLVMEKCVKNKRMKQLEVYGNCVQNGTPTPENPVEVESIGELVTDVNDANYGKYKVPVVVRGKNLFDAKQYEAELQHGYILNNDGEKVADKNSTYSSYRIPIYKGQTVCISGWFQRLYVFNAEDVFVKRMQNYSGTVMNTRYTPTEDGYIRLQIWNATYNANKGKEQIESGSIATEYEPYVEPITTNVYLNEPLGSGDVLNFKDKKVSNDYGFKEAVECELPVLMAKTSIVEIGTTVAPSNMKGKYIKK